MKRLAHAPNLAIATLWADLLTQEGFDATVQRAYASGIAGEIPPDQAQPEIWLLDDERFDAAKARLHQLQHPPVRQWACPRCHEIVDGPFGQCWNCGALEPAAP